MMSSIVDADGYILYAGSEDNPKFARLLAIDGNSKIESVDGAFKRAKWNGSEWVEGHVPDYIEKRLNEYPTIAELTIALYDSDDKAALEKRRSDTKAKYPKPE